MNLNRGTSLLKLDTPVQIDISLRVYYIFKTILFGSVLSENVIIKIRHYAHLCEPFVVFFLDCTDDIVEDCLPGHCMDQIELL